MSAFNGKRKLQSPNKAQARSTVAYRRKLTDLKRVIKDLVLENAYLCDEVAQVHEDTLILKEEVRSLLKRLHQLEANAGIESTLQPVAVGLTAQDSQVSTPAPKKAVKRKAVQDEEVNGNSVSHAFKPKAGGKSKTVKEEHFEVDIAD